MFPPIEMLGQRKTIATTIHFADFPTIRRLGNRAVRFIERIDSLPHRKWKETKQQPSMLTGPAVPACCLVSFHFLWGKLSTRTVVTCACAHCRPLNLTIRFRSLMIRKDIQVFPLSAFQATLGRDARRQLSRRREQGHVAAEGRNGTAGKKEDNDNRLRRWRRLQFFVEIYTVTFLLMDWSVV